MVYGFGLHSDKRLMSNQNSMGFNWAEKNEQ